MPLYLVCHGEDELKKPSPEVVLRWVSQAWKAVPADLIKHAFLTCGISNQLDGSEDRLAMAHRRSQLTAEVDVDDDIIANGFFGNNCQEPESDEESGVAIFDLDFDAILAAMYAVSISAEGDCYVGVPPDPGIEAAALGASESAAPGASESALSGTASAQVFHTFTLDSGASRSFFRGRTTLTPLSRPVAVSLADPSEGPILARYSTVLPCPAAPSSSLSGLYLPSFSTNLVSGADLQDAGVDQFTPASQRVTHCTCAQTGRHLATFTRRPGSSLYTLTT
ncbi:unnamed protein product [Closterium sp. NIES-54]